MYGFIADLFVAIHVSYVSYVILGQILIWLGWILGWKWIRNFWFRITHLVAIGIVVYEEMMDIRCPLTVWEEHYRELAGQPVSGETFLGRLLHSLIFFDFQPWVFATIYYSCFTLVVITLLLCRPRWPMLKKSK